jgi:O-antigen/teichoic acid export membrane protein
MCEVGALGLPSSVAYHIASRGARGATLRQALPIAGVQLAVLWLAHICVTIWLFRNDPAMWHPALVGLLTIPITGILQYSLAVHQGERRFGVFNTLRVLPVLAYSSVLVCVYVGGVATLTTVAVAWSTGYFIAAVFGLVSLLRTRVRDAADARVDKVVLLRYGLKGFLGNNSLLQTFRLDQAYVAFALTPTELGHYVVALSLTNLPLLIGGSIGAVSFPDIAASSGAEARAHLWRSARLVGVLGGIVTVVLFYATPTLIGVFFGAAFLSSVPVARVLLLSGFLQACRRVLSDGFRGAGLPQTSSYAEVAGWVVLCGAAMLLGPYRLIGVAWALAVSSAASCAWLLTAATALSTSNEVAMDLQPLTQDES